MSEVTRGATGAHKKRTHIALCIRVQIKYALEAEVGCSSCCLHLKFSCGTSSPSSSFRKFPATPKMSCAHCGKPGAVKGCSACKTTRYCDEDCQRAHWPLHKGPCKETQRAAARAAAAPPPPPPAGPFVLDLHCGHCSAEVKGYDSTKCGACNRVAYCRPACQKAHWAVHKEACGAATRARVHAGEGELEGAEGTLKRAMEKAQREQGEESCEALDCMSTYARFLKQVARFEEAGTLFR